MVSWWLWWCHGGCDGAMVVVMVHACKHCWSGLLKCFVGCLVGAAVCVNTDHSHACKPSHLPLQEGGHGSVHISHFSWHMISYAD